MKKLIAMLSFALFITISNLFSLDAVLVEPDSGSTLNIHSCSVYFEECIG